MRGIPRSVTLVALLVAGCTEPSAPPPRAKPEPIETQPPSSSEPEVPPAPSCEDDPVLRLTDARYVVPTAAGPRLLVAENRWPGPGGRTQCERVTLVDLQSGAAVGRVVLGIDVQAHTRRSSEVEDVFEQEGRAYAWVVRGDLRWLVGVDPLELLLEASPRGLEAAVPGLAPDSVAEVHVEGFTIRAMTKDGHLWRVDPRARTAEKLPPGTPVDPATRTRDQQLARTYRCLAGALPLEVTGIRPGDTVAGRELSTVECPRCRIAVGKRGEPGEAVFLEPMVLRPRHPGYRREPLSAEQRQCRAEALGDASPVLIRHRESLESDAYYQLSGLDDEGTERWRVPLDSENSGPLRLTAALVLMDARMILGGAAFGQVRAIDRQTGELRWLYPDVPGVEKPDLE